MKLLVSCSKCPVLKKITYFGTFLTILPSDGSIILQNSRFHKNRTKHSFRAWVSRGTSKFDVDDGKVIYLTREQTYTLAFLEQT